MPPRSATGGLAWELNAYTEGIRTVVDTVRSDQLHALGVLVTNTDLAPVDYLKVSTVSLTFQEQSYSWETVTGANGQQVNKLVTS